MPTQANATFEVKSWDETPYEEREGGSKMTRAKVTKAFHGDLEGEGAVEYLMFYREDGTASFVGHELITGRLGDQTGSFVLQHSGSFEGGVASAVWTVVPGSGTGELAGLKGHGGFGSAHAESYTLTLEYDFE